MMEQNNESERCVNCGEYLASCICHTTTPIQETTDKLLKKLMLGTWADLEYSCRKNNINDPQQLIESLLQRKERETKAQGRIEGFAEGMKHLDKISKEVREETIKRVMEVIGEMEDSREIWGSNAKQRCNGRNALRAELKVKLDSLLNLNKE
jgi:hypothetical protein